ncbi:hypothetical protein OG432_13525 [Streptomyces sp. NBC_00442]|uniref:hypothetical protein n=1 Tax=Streptomyces sp. NBC_00442 TaxID=2903651 RepID=UPI002E1E81DC
MEPFTFDLTPIHSATVHGYRGLMGPFGAVTVCAEVTKQSGCRNQVVVDGDRLPRAVFTSGREGGRPALPGGRLTLDGTEVALDLRGEGFLKASRWLDVRCGERSYVYRSTGPSGPGRDVTLRRPGAVVTIRRAVGHLGIERTGTAEGSVDATDLAVALVLEPADTSALTRAGTLLDASIGILGFRDTRGDGRTV